MNDNIATLGTANSKKYRVNLQGTKFDLKKCIGRKAIPGITPFVEEPPTFRAEKRLLAVSSSKNIRYPKEAVEKEN